MNVFELAYSWWEDYVPYLFFGKDDVSQEEFEILCKELLPEAAKLAMSKSIDENGQYSWVGWPDIVENMIPLLEQHGFSFFKPKKIIFSGSGIIDEEKEAEGLGISTPLVLEHNSKVREQMEEEMRQENLPEYQGSNNLP